jgi:hypothetical protein
MRSVIPDLTLADMCYSGFDGAFLHLGCIAGEADHLDFLESKILVSNFD